MARWFVELTLKFRILVIALAAALMAFGVRAALKGELVEDADVLPEFNRPYVEIQTEALGLSAAEVEAMITVPLEADMLNGVPWVEEIRSESIPGLSSIVMVFKPGTDILAARQMVQERLTEVHALPNVAKPPAMINPVSSTNRVMMVGLSSKELSLIEMSVLARWTIKPRLMGVPGVANVSIWGQRERQLQVQVDPEELKEKGVTLDQVVSTTGNALWFSPLKFLDASLPGTGGWIDTPNQRLGVRHLLPITTPEDLAQVTVEGTSMPLGEVADVVENHQPLIGDAIVNDEPSLLLVIEKFPGASTLEVTRATEAALAALQPGLSGIELDPTIYRPASFVETATSNLTWAAVIGVVLVALALGVFYYEWRPALISFAAMAMAVTAAGLVLHLRGAPPNMMVLAGFLIALAALIDDAIIDTQNVVRRVREHRRAKSDQPLPRIILEASVEARSALGYATLIIALAVVPVFFMEGLSRAFLQPVALTYVLALLVSTLVALFVTPALSMVLLNGMPVERRESPVIAWLRRGYETVLARTVSGPRAAYVGIGAVLLVGVVALPWLRQESFLPTFKERDLLIELDGKPGTSHPEMARITAAAGRELRSIPGVRNVGAHVGRAIMSDEVADVSSGEIWVSIDSTADYDETVAAIREVIDGYPGLDRDVLTFLNEKSSEELGGADEAAVVRVYGEDLKLLNRKAEEVKQVLAGIEGLVDLHVERPVEQPTLEIEVDLERAKPHGIKPGDVRRAAATLLSGIGVGNLFEEQKVFDVVVWGTPDTRQSVSSIRNLLIDTPGGGHVRLGEVADVRIASAPTVIERDAVSRYVDVAGNVQGRDLGAVARDIQSGLKEVELPLEFRAELLGESAQRQAAQQRVLSFAVAAAILIFLLLHKALHGSWRLAALFFVTLPTALVGGVLVVLAGGGLLSLGALIGFITVGGIAVRQGIMLIRHYQQLAVNPPAGQVDADVALFRAQFDQGTPLEERQQQDGELVGPELVLRGTRDRFASVVTTAALTGLAFLPLALFGNAAGLEIVQPMAVVILGGLVTSTLFSLFAVPVMYVIAGAGRETELEDLPVTEAADEEMREIMSRAGVAETELQST